MKSKWWVIFLCTLIGARLAYSGPSKVDVHLIIRHYDTRIEIENEERATVFKSITGQLLSNAGGIYFPYTSTYYDDFKKVKSIRLTIFDLEGKVKGKFRRKDFTDQAISGSGTIFSDNRILYYEMKNFTPPFIFKIEIEEELNQLMAISSWAPVRHSGIRLEAATLSISHPIDFKIAFKSNLMTEYDKNRSGTITHQWTVDNFAAVPELSSYDTPMFQVVPWVRWVPEEFHFGGLTGGFSSWQKFGSWLYEMGRGSNEIPAELQEKIEILAKGAESKEEKIKLIYQFVQQNYRYVSIQLGIGGWVPASVEEVYREGYGDCKALSNLTKSMLDAAGVDSYYAVIQSGSDQADFVERDFPSNSFNHAVVFVPMKEDTILLECTSQTLPPAFRSSFTDDRYALVVSEEGSQLVRSPKYRLEDNLQVDSIVVQIEENGTARLKSQSVLSGVLAGLIELDHQPVSDQKAWLADHIQFGLFDIEAFEMNLSESGSWNYQTSLKTSLVSEDFVSMEDNRIFIRPDVFHSFGKIELPETVYYSFNLLRPYQYSVSCHVNYPDGYRIEYLPEELELKNSFGSYNIKFEVDEEKQKIHIHRSLVILAGRYPKSDYSEYKNFRAEIRKKEEESLVLVK